MYPVKHEDGRRDKRYTISREYTGAHSVQYVARFCGDWVGCGPNKGAATWLAIEHNRARWQGGENGLQL